MPATGPTTSEGKAIASRNSITHGLSTDAIVLPSGERQEDWDAFRIGFVDALHPEGPVENYLATRAAELAWRLRRVTRAEHDSAFLRQARAADVIQDSDRDAASLGEKSFYGSGYALGASRRKRDFAYKSLPDPADLQHIIRYEAHLGRQMYAALHELEARQAQREGRGAPLARVQVQGLPGL